MDWKKEMLKQPTGIKHRAEFFLKLERNQQMEFLDLDPKKQAGLLRIPDRRCNRWLREYNGLDSVLTHCEHAINKKDLRRAKEWEEFREIIALREKNHKGKKYDIEAAKKDDLWGALGNRDYK